MDIGTEDDRETWITAPERTTAPAPVELPEPATQPAEPAKV